MTIDMPKHCYSCASSAAKGMAKTVADLNAELERLVDEIAEARTEIKRLLAERTERGENNVEA